MYGVRLRRKTIDFYARSTKTPGIVSHDISRSRDSTPDQVSCYDEYTSFTPQDPESGDLRIEHRLEPN